MSDYDDYEGPINTIPDYDPDIDTPPVYIPLPDEEPGGGTIGFPSVPSGGGTDWSASFAALMKALGLSSGGAGGAGALLPVLAALFGAGGLINSNSKNEDAAKQIQDAANKANEQGTALIGGARQDFQPYMQAGTAALPQLQAMVGNNNLAGTFGGPVAPGANLADKFKGSMSLAALARK